jgi:F-type H+-transporting ATPase subunit a
MSQENPLHHFELEPIVPIEVMGVDLSLNKAVFAMWGGMAIVFILFMIVVKGGLKTVPGKMQNIAEIFIEFIKGMVGEFIGKEGMKYFPFVATLFFFIMSCNLIGLIPGSYTITSQLVVTGIFATIIFIMTLIIGFAKHGAHFLSILVPPGVPKIMIPVMVPIEMISMLARPLSLSVRLFANMTAGHTVLYDCWPYCVGGAVWFGPDCTGMDQLDAIWIYDCY